MAVRAMWRGVLHLGEERVGVKLHAALQSRKVHFRLLDAEEQAPIRQELVDPSTDTPVPRDAVQRGYPLEEGVYAVLQPDDLEALVPEASRAITFSRFLPHGAIESRWYDRAYWLSPDGDPAGYFALAEALRREEREGIAHWVMRKKRYHGSLRVRGEHLVLIRLRYAEELVPVSALPSLPGRAPEAREIDLARQLVAALVGPFEPDDFPETWSDRVRALIEAKREGKVVKMPARPKPRDEADLYEALRQSIEAVGSSGG